MTKSVTLDGIDQLPSLMAGIEADIDQINYAGLLENELMRLSDLHKGYFDSSTGPDGQPWAANAPSTIAQKGHSVVLRGIQGTRERNAKATKRRPSVRFSRSRGIAGFRLATSLTAKTTQSFGDAIREAIQEQPGVAYLTFGTEVPYSIYNQLGTSRIPARPHIGINSAYLDGMVERAADYTMRKLTA